MWQTYYTPTSLDEALRLLAEHSQKADGPPARIIAGGTDLLVELQRGVRQARTLIDITRIGKLDRVELDDKGIIHIGPMVTHNHVIASKLLVERAFPLVQACWQVGSPQLRNRGTVAGNLATASPANDTITALRATGAWLKLSSVRGERTLTLANFYQGVRQTDLAPDEMITDITFPALAPNQRGTFVKLGLRRAQAIAIVNAAVMLTFGQPTKQSTITHACITLGSVAPTIIRAREAERVLARKKLSAENITQAAELAARAAAPIDDIRAGADYRSEAVRVLVHRALTALTDGTERAGFPSDPPLLWGRTRGRYPRLAGKTIRHRDQGAESIECTVNGKNVVVQGAGGKTLLAMLRDDLGLTGSKEGCAEGECGACTVWMNGVAVLACLTPAPRAHGTQIVTVEGLARRKKGTDTTPLHPVQQAFIDEGAVQCGYCTPGFVMAGANLLDEIPHPTREQIIAGLSGNLCRCTGYYKIVRAIEKAAEV
ncbi:MAG: 2Fe-2S iron-sulfur cluster binding domain-containing protein [Chloroflexi bacterium]|nr:2Fe-2S iron-sulfur cluster binding domain-containing protein [Chloroflexota bacterium]